MFLWLWLFLMVFGFSGVQPKLSKRHMSESDHTVSHSRSSSSDRRFSTFQLSIVASRPPEECITFCIFSDSNGSSGIVSVCDNSIVQTTRIIKHVCQYPRLHSSWFSHIEYISPYFLHNSRDISSARGDILVVGPSPG